jgi:hypothetical protein
LIPNYRSIFSHKAKKKINTLWIQKDEDKPKTECWVSNLVQSCDIFFDWKFYTKQDNYTFRSKNGEKKAFRAQKRNLSPKSIYSSGISIDQKYYLNEEKPFF